MGDAVEKNLSKAFSYFERAAAMESDGDSLFNAGHCLEHGLGTDKDLARAASLYRLAAEKFGHFDSAHVLGERVCAPVSQGLTTGRLPDGCILLLLLLVQASCTWTAG